MSTKTETNTKLKLKQPSLYKVLLFNDDFTPMQFVIEVLVEIFGKNLAEAEALTLQVHNNKRGVAGVYNREIAEQKVRETLTAAQFYGHPLKVTMEEA